MAESSRPDDSNKPTEPASQKFAWNAGLYSQFLSERTRPAYELIARVPTQIVKTAVDLGCGPGNSTAVVHERFGDATILGVDNSPEMLAQAGEHYKDSAHLRFLEGDIGGFATTYSAEYPAQKLDLIFSNAALHWIPDHKELVPSLLNLLNPEGTLAFQMPDNFNEVTHSSMRDVATENKWSADLSAVRGKQPILTAQEYYDLLKPKCQHVDIWQTRYFHVMDNAEAAAEWLKGTGLRPFLAALPADEADYFLSLYVQRLKIALPQRAGGKVLMPFPRLFVIGQVN